MARRVETPTREPAVVVAEPIMQPAMRGCFERSAHLTVSDGMHHTGRCTKPTGHEGDHHCLCGTTWVQS